jgi:DNA invertase Pin-like site-specific DNA recombinase
MSRDLAEMRARLAAAKHGAQRHPREVIALVKAALLANISQSEIERITKVSRSTIKKISSGKLHRDVAPDPEYVARINGA